MLSRCDTVTASATQICVMLRCPAGLLIPEGHTHAPSTNTENLQSTILFGQETIAPLTSRMGMHHGLRGRWLSSRSIIKNARCCHARSPDASCIWRSYNSSMDWASLNLMQGSGSLHTCGRILPAASANLNVASVSFASSLSGLTCPMITKPPPPSTELCNHRQITSAFARPDIEATGGCAGIASCFWGPFKQPKLTCCVDLSNWCLGFQKARPSATHLLYAAGSMQQPNKCLLAESVRELNSLLCPWSATPLDRCIIARQKKAAMKGQAGCCKVKLHYVFRHQFAM